MAKTIVSIRIPKTLLHELKQKTIHQHYLDTSEFVRGIVRKRFLRDQNPIAYELKSLQTQLTTELKAKDQEQQKAWLLKQLEDIKATMEGHHGK